MRRDSAFLPPDIRVGEHQHAGRRRTLPHLLFAREEFHFLPRSGALVHSTPARRTNFAAARALGAPGIARSKSLACDELSMRRWVAGWLVSPEPNQTSWQKHITAVVRFEWQWRARTVPSAAAYCLTHMGCMCIRPFTFCSTLTTPAKKTSRVRGGRGDQGERE